MGGVAQSDGVVPGVTYTWRQTAGPTVVLDGADGPTQRFEALDAGTDGSAGIQPHDGEGCGCRSSGTGAGPLAVALATLLALRRRRRQVNGGSSEGASRR